MENNPHLHSNIMGMVKQVKTLSKMSYWYFIPKDVDIEGMGFYGRASRSNQRTDALLTVNKNGEI